MSHRDMKSEKRKPVVYFAGQKILKVFLTES